MGLRASQAVSTDSADPAGSLQSLPRQCGDRALEAQAHYIIV